MATWYWRRAGVSGGSNNGTSEANAWQGAGPLNTAINAGTVQGGDIVNFVPSEGPTGLGDRNQFPANTRSESTGFSGSDFSTTTGGIQFGTSTAASSSASGIRFFFNSSAAQPAMDMSSGALVNSERMFAGMRFRGEDIEIHGFYGKASTWSYIRRDSDGSTRIPGTSSATDAETVSNENLVMSILGNGNQVYDSWFDGASKWCRYALYMAPAALAVSGASQYKTNIIQNVECWGANQGIDVQKSGSADFDLKRGQKLIVRDVRVRDAAWGVGSGMSVAPYNAQAHGNGIRITGKYYGGAELYDFEVSGGYQDAVIAGCGTSLVVRDGYIHDVGDDTFREWQWNTGTSRWELSGTLNNTHGNGVKCGLSSFDGTSGSTWLSAGTAGGTVNVGEVRTILLRLKIRRVRAYGITTNDSRGTMIHACEVDDSGNVGINLQPSTRTGNFWISNCFVRKISSEPSNFALLVQANARVCGMFNNIFWSNPSVSSQVDVRWNTTIAVPSGQKNKNLLVTGRSGVGTGATYPTTGDISPQTPSWTPDSGLSSGSSLLTAGTNISDPAEARTTGTSWGIKPGVGTSQVVDRQRWANSSTLPLGPYA